MGDLYGGKFSSVYRSDLWSALMISGFILGMLMAMGIALQTPTLHWEEFQAPAYPQMARIANIYGKVEIQFIISEGGRVDIKSAMGHPILVQAAVESIKLSKLSCEYCERVPTEFSVIYDFIVRGSECGNSSLNTPPGVVLDTFNRVIISTDRFCLEDPGPVLMKRIRSLRCLDLWRCATKRS
ncbi:MAG TPA: energy transducer TonB [Candidatus Angelobacter sp.]